MINPSSIVRLPMLWSSHFLHMIFPENRVPPIGSKPKGMLFGIML